MSEPKTQVGEIAKQEGATCTLCDFSDNYDDMIRRHDEEGGGWYHRECLDEMNEPIEKLL